MRTVSIMPKAHKALCLWLALLLFAALLLPGVGLAEARYPQLRGPVTDDANAISQAIAADIASFQTLAVSRTGVTVYVAFVHFLDGEDAQTYASTLFSRWGLGEDDFLLLGAVGEDAFASASGKSLKAKFSDANAQSLLFSSGFGALFKEQRYDAALSQYFEAFADMLSKQYGADIRLGKLFSAHLTASEEAPAPSQSSKSWPSLASDMWNSFNERFDDSARSYADYESQQERESKSLGSTGWIVLLILFILIMSQRRPLRRTRNMNRNMNRNRNGRSGCMGCGCSPLGWIFSGLGLGWFLRKTR